MKTKKVRIPKIKGGAKLATEAEKNALARRIQKDMSAWSKKTLKGG